MKKIIFTFTGLCFLFTGYKNLPGPLSAGAPAGSTGAPLERHCATSGCHSDFPLNSGTAEIFFSVGSGGSKYEPGKTYPAEVTVSDAGLMRFGFQVVALNEENENAGTILLTEPLRTQIIPGYDNLSNRRYITYTYEGTPTVSPELGKWTFEWTAPQSDEGNITFYLAVIAANNDGTDQGDYCHTRTLTLLSSAEVPSAWDIFPSAGSGIFTIQVPDLCKNLTVYNTFGQKIYETEKPEAGNQTMDLTKQPDGVYFVSLTQNEKSEIRKIIITK